MRLTGTLEENGEKTGKKTLQISEIIIWVFLVGSAVGLMGTYYLAEVRFQGKLNDFFNKVYFIFLIGIVFWSGILRLKENMRTNLLMMIISTTLGVYFIEIFFYIDTRYTEPTIPIELDFEQTTPLQVVQAMQANGQDAVPAYSPYTLIHSDGFFWKGASLSSGGSFS